MNGYYEEMHEYELFNTDLRLFLNRLKQAKGVLVKKYEDLETYYRNTDPAYANRPVTLLDILKQLTTHRG
jgi:hypothetical protein